MQAVGVISMFAGILLVMLLFFVLMIACLQSLDFNFNSTTTHMLFALLGLTAFFIFIDALLLLRMALVGFLLTSAWIATPPAVGNALPESGRSGRLWSRMNLLLRTATRALASSSPSARASTHAMVRRPAQAHAPQPQAHQPRQLNEIAIVL